MILINLFISEAQSLPQKYCSCAVRVDNDSNNNSMDMDNDNDNNIFKLIKRNCCRIRNKKF